MIRFALQLLLAAALLVATVDSCPAQSELAEQIRSLDPNVLTDAELEAAAGMIERDIRVRRLAANQDNRAEWREVYDSRADWEFYRDNRIKRLRESLGEFPPEPEQLSVHTTGEVAGDGFRIENVVYESRPGNWVTGNLYRPDEPLANMPGLLIVHAHHTAKTHGELQDMGMTWARAGCLVLVIDQVGYGERRAHPFNGPDDYDGEFRASRQDYYYRYDSGIELSVAGDSLMGWFVWDLMRGVDLLLSRDADPSRIIILGSVAGGGDPCAVTAALDRRIGCAVPFNFGGLQPESYPLPENADENFNYAMSSYWDSTRGLPRTCSDGFFHWLIVGSIAPRPLIYAHEFMWDREHDPIWKRFQHIYNDFYDQPENLAFAVGVGSVRDSSDVATHCTHIGRFHRQFIHPEFEKWFGIHVGPDDEYSQRVSADELRCMTDEYRERLHPKSLPELSSALGASRVAAMRQRIGGEPLKFHRQIVRREWAGLLGPIDVNSDSPSVRTVSWGASPDVTEGRVVLEPEEGIQLPTLLLLPRDTGPETPIVIGVSQAGKEAFLDQRSEQVAELLGASIAVCLPDVRGTGESRSDAERGRTSNDTNLSVNLEMFGETLVGQRLRDLRYVLAWLRTLDNVDATNVAVWGDSFVKPNPPDTDFNIPHDVDRAPHQPEPLGGLLALFAALYEEDVRAISIHRGLVSYASILESPHVYVPHDAVVPQALNAGDLLDLAANLRRTRVRLDSMVDGLNRAVSSDRVRELVAESRVEGSDVEITVAEDGHGAAWLIDVLRNPG